jgi:hypothetical protein
MKRFHYPYQSLERNNLLDVDQRARDSYPPNGGQVFSRQWRGFTLLKRFRYLFRSLARNNFMGFPWLFLQPQARDRVELLPLQC